jgi:hypothetical protein
MDANLTRFQLLLGHADWANCLDWRMRPLRESWENSTGALSLTNHASGKGSQLNATLRRLTNQMSTGQ